MNSVAKRVGGVLQSHDSPENEREVPGPHLRRLDFPSLTLRQDIKVPSQLLPEKRR